MFIPSGSTSHSLPPLHVPPPPVEPPPTPRQQYMRDVNAQWNHDHSGPMPPSNPRVRFLGADGSHIPTSADAPPGRALGDTGERNTELSRMVDGNYTQVRGQHRELRRTLEGIVDGPGDRAAKRDALARELHYVDNASHTPHLSSTIRDELAYIHRDHPDLVDPEWFTPLRPPSQPGSRSPSPE